MRIDTLEELFEYCRPEGHKGCLVWTRSVNKYGYGNVAWRNKRKEHYLTHRIAWELAYGPIPSVDVNGERVFVCHDCDNPPCCNPTHLFLGTSADNTRDMHQKGRASKRSTLTIESVRGIRDLASTTDLSDYEIGRRFDVSHTTVYHIVTGKTWADIK